jgi:cobalt-zinc-cadmium efflux system outer membrane protein
LLAADQITTLAARVSQAWFDYAAARRIETLRDRSLAATRAAMDNLIVMAANGDRYSALDVAVSRNGLFTIEANRTRAALDTASARTKLGELLGLTGWHDDWEIAAELPPIPPADPDVAALEATAMQRRFDTQAAAKAVDTRLRALSSEKRWRWLGTLELGAFKDRAAGGTSFTGPTAVVELPVFGQKQAQLLAADSQLRTAMRQLEATQLSARTQVRTHAAEMRTTRALLEQYQNAVLPNQRQILAALGTAEPGQPDRLRLRLEALSAEEGQVGLLRDYWRARSALALAAGDWTGTSGLPLPATVTPVSAPATP